MVTQEIGGYLPLELSNGRSLFDSIPDEQILKVNTGRTALWYAIESLQVKKVYAPYYYCPDIISMLDSMNVEVSYYRIDESFLPIDVPVESSAAVILVDYFGVMGERVHRFAKRFPKVIFDNAHAYFTPPVIRKNVMNVYSCRKFVGVCDGAYLIGEGITKPELEQDVSFSRACHLLKSLELGTNAAYLENKHNELELGNRRLAMSELTRRILNSVDYDAIANRRRRNFQYLHEQLKDIQLLNIPSDNPVPYAYPLLLDQDIHRKLVENKIYVPYLWSQLLEPEWEGSIEARYSANIVPLPLDQRYESAQLQRLLQVIKVLFK